MGNFGSLWKFIDDTESVGLPREIIFKKIKRMFIGKSSKECTICFNPYNRGSFSKNNIKNYKKY